MRAYLLLTVFALSAVLLGGCAQPYRGNSLDAARELCPSIIAELLPPAIHSWSRVDRISARKWMLGEQLLDTRTFRITKYFDIPEEAWCAGNWRGSNAYDPVTDTVFFYWEVSDNEGKCSPFLESFSLKAGEKMRYDLAKFNGGKGIGERSLCCLLGAWNGKVVLADTNLFIVLDMAKQVSTEKEVYLDATEAVHPVFCRSGPWVVTGNRWSWWILDMSGEEPQTWNLILDNEEFAFRAAFDSLHGKFAFWSDDDPYSVILYEFKGNGPSLVGNVQMQVGPGYSHGPLWFTESGELLGMIVPYGDTPAPSPKYFRFSVSDGKVTECSAEDMGDQLFDCTFPMPGGWFRFPSGAEILDARRRTGLTPGAWIVSAQDGTPVKRQILILEGGRLAVVEPFAITLFDGRTGKVLDAVPAPTGEFFCEGYMVQPSRAMMPILRERKYVCCRGFDFSSGRIVATGETPPLFPPIKDDDLYTRFGGHWWGLSIEQWEPSTDYANWISDKDILLNVDLFCIMRDGRYYVVNDRTGAIHEVPCEGWPIADDMVLSFCEGDDFELVSSSGKRVRFQAKDYDDDTNNALSFRFTSGSDTEFLSVDLRNGNLWRMVIPCRMKAIHYLQDGMALVEDQFTLALYLCKMTPCEPDERTAELVKFVKDVSEGSDARQIAQCCLREQATTPSPIPEAGCYRTTWPTNKGRPVARPSFLLPGCS
ncbi:MAG: hypothetical protein WC712_13375 [Candidatus Brocadiia bacterium]